MINSPYDNVPVQEWKTVTRRLIEEHPLSKEEIVNAVISSWNSIFDSSLGTKGFKIGKDIFPKPQIMGFLLHELIPLELAAKYPTMWRGEENTSDKDIVYIPDDHYSIEVKTSSNPAHIYGNRSYAQGTTDEKKVKSGYYLAVNFGKFVHNKIPHIILIRFGWLDADDWIGQKAPTGQQSHLNPDAENYKLLVISK
jgi:hypothetical protein